MITFAFILTIFMSSNDGTLAKADVHVLDRGLTAEDCMSLLEAQDADKERTIGIYSCSLDYDF